jgi:DNA primase
MPSDYEDFKIIDFLEDYDIYYRTSGDNVGRGWIGIDCPFPGCSAVKQHCGINMTSKCFSCFQCGEKGGLPKLIKQLLNISWADTYDIIRKYSGSPKIIAPPVSCETAQTVKLPPYCSPLEGKAAAYLRKRNFDPKYIGNKYKVMRSGLVSGKYSLRLIIPIFMGGKMVAYTSRDYTGLKSPKYRESPVAESVIPPKECLYNIDSVTGNYVIIVEGPMDVWRMGDGCVCLFTVTATKAQLELLQKLSSTVQRYIVLLDPGTEKPAEKLARKIYPFAKELKVVTLLKKDPAELTPQEAMNLKMSFVL